MLGLVRAGRVAPRIAPTLGRADAEVGANLLVEPLGQPFGSLDAEPVGEELLGELAVLFELVHQVGDLGADGHALERDHVTHAVATERPVEVGQADPVVLRLPGEDEPVDLLVRVFRIEDDQFVAVGVAGEVDRASPSGGGSPARPTCAPAADGSPR